MPSKRYTLVLNFGYVESQALSYMPWVSTGTYKDAKEALLDLAIFLKEKFQLDRQIKLKKCCELTRSKDPEAKYCSKCGISIENAEFDGEEYMDWVRQLNCDTDTFHGYIEWDPEHRWQAGDLEGAPNQRFVYQAEMVLAAAVGYYHREERTFEFICKERTKSKKESFSYW